MDSPAPTTMKRRPRIPKSRFRAEASAPAPAITLPGLSRTGCATRAPIGDPLLPVAGTGSLSMVRKSSRAPWRAAVLIGIHVIFLAHVAHYLTAGRSLSPVEPSESMYTLELGRVNAGFIFFFLAIVSTLVFGRFFCGWGCHIVALQDFCGFLMKKMGIRPRPFRSRLLLLVPAFLALYMFVWPTFVRLVFGSPNGPFPGFTNHLVTADFWRTFAGPLFASLTFASCGFAAVYTLGAKGFCTYGCPYGAVFGAADRFSMGRILVNDDCEQCGHCTATCTSNVLVHDEVRRFGMVVDPGCMKCMDCISVCPKHALRFGFAKPAVFGPRPADPAPRKYDLPLTEEIGVLAVCAAATIVFRGLYDGPPLLMAVALGGITGFVALRLAHLARRPTVRIQNVVLKAGGKITRAGAAFAALAALWLAFTVHSGVVQWARAQGARDLARTSASRDDVLSGAFTQKSYPPQHRQALDAAFTHLSLADRWGLFGVVGVKLDLAWCLLLRGDDAGAERRIREAVALAPSNLEVRQNLVDLFAARGRLADASSVLSEKIAIERRSLSPVASVPDPRAPAAGPGPRPAEKAGVDAGLVSPHAAVSSASSTQLAADLFALGSLLVGQERLADAAQPFAECVALAPGSQEARFNYGGVLRRLGRTNEAVAQLRAAEEIAPSDAETQVELGLALMESGQDAAALSALRRAIKLAPDTPEARMHLPELIRELEARTAARSSDGR
jgi:Flp pilus assembly protein TadD/ferredoxin